MLRTTVYQTALLLTILYLTACSTESTPVYTVQTSVTPNGSGTITSSPAGQNFDKGTELTFTANANNGYIFNGWQGDLSGSSNPSSITLNKDVSITAIFEEKAYPLIIVIAEGGTVTEEVIQAKTDYDYGTIVRLTAIPESGWEFVSWSGDYEGNNPIVDITVTKALTITVNFSRKATTISLYSIDLEGKTSYSSKKIRWLEGAFHSTIYYRHQGEEFLFTNGGTNWNDANDLQAASILLKKNGGKWEFLEEYDIDITSEFRNAEFSEDGLALVGCDHGAEVPDLNGNGQNDEWPFGHLFYGEISSTGIEWTQVSQIKSFYHSCAVGDVNNDGLLDVIGGHLGTRPYSPDNPHVYLQTETGFEYQPNFVSEAKHPGYFVQIEDVVGDSRPEIINWTFDGGDNGDYVVLDIQTPDDNGVYRLYTEYLDDRLMAKAPPVYQSNQIVSTETSGNWITDFDQDGLIDLAVENDVYDTNILFNNGDGTFERVQVTKKGSAWGQDRWDGNPLRYEHYYMGYEIIDIFNDGLPDLVTREPDYHFDDQENIYPGDNVWINNGDRTFSRLNDLYDDTFKINPKSIHPFSDLCGGPFNLGFLKGFVNKDGKFGWYGFMSMGSSCEYIGDYELYYIEIMTQFDASYVD